MVSLEEHDNKQIPHDLMMAMTSLGTTYRLALQEEGFPTSTHIYDLDFKYCDKSNPSIYLSFLKNLKKYYFSLNRLNRKIFVNEVLEKGEHYNFWWMKFVDTEEEYRTVCTNLILNINRNITRYYA